MDSRIGSGYQRDSKGKFVAVAIQRVIYKGNVAYIEAKAVSLGIQVTQKIKCLPMIIELDSKEVVDLARNRKWCKSEIFWTVVAIQASLKSLNQVQIQHVSWACNTSAHDLVKITLDYDTLVVWLGTSPTKIMVLFSDFHQ